MIFHDRAAAAELLVKKLTQFKSKPGTIVLALPRGGVVLGKIIADKLQLPLDIVVPRKIGAPENEEYAIGAITESGETVWNEVERARVSASYVAKVIAEQQAEAKRRLALYRPPQKPRELRGKTVLLVDDGIATGLTIKAAIATVKQEGAAKIIIAVPVCPPDSKPELEALVDQVIVLNTPVIFGAIGNFYEQFGQVEDNEVIALLKK